MLVGISLTECGRASGGGPKRGTERDGAVPCVKIADGVDATTTRNRHVASTLLCNVRICFLLIYGYSRVPKPLPLPASRDSVAAVDTKRDGNHMSIS